MKKAIFISLALFVIIQSGAIAHAKSFLRLKSLLKSKTDLSRYSREDGAAATGPLKRPIKETFLNATQTSYGYNKPLVVLDYDLHEQGIINNKDLDMDDLCVLKQGFIGLVTNEIPFDGKTGTPDILKVKPVFAVLNKYSLSLFENEHLSTLTRTFPLAELVNINQKTTWNVSGIFCQELYRAAQKAPGQTTSNTQKALAVCFRDAASQEGWKRAIEQYRDCSKTLQEENGAEEVEAEGPEIRKVKKDAAADADAKIKALEEADQKREEEEEAEKQKMNEAMDKMRGVMNGLKDAMNKKNIDEEKDRQRALEERNRLIELQDFLHKNEDCLQEDENNKMNESEEQALDQITDKNDQGTADLALAAKDKVMTDAEKERLIAKFAEMDQLNAERNMNEKLKKMMIQVTKGFEQVLDSGDCFSNDLGLNPVGTIHKVCGNIYAIERPPKLQELLTCIDPSKFCDTCCDNYIGAAHEKNRLECKMECREKLKGVGPQVLVPVNRMIYKLQNNEKLKTELQQKFTQIQASNNQRRRRRRL